MAVPCHDDPPAPKSDDNDFLSLCARYPEITFDVEMESMARTPRDQIQSSPLSSPEGDEEELTRLSDSTVHTTPLRGRGILMHSQLTEDTLSGFIRLVRSSDLDDECSQIFVRLACTTNMLGEAVRSLDLSVSSHNSTDDILSLCQSLLSPACEALGRIENHIQNISRLKSLVAFNTQPTEDCLWSTYRQRAQLIIRYTTLPSRNESQLTSALANLYNRQVYRPFFDLFDENESDVSSVSRVLNKLYDTIMTWQEKYKSWCSHMKDLKYRYMLPLLRKIQATPRVLHEVRELNAAKTAANEVLVRPGAPGTLPLDDDTIKAFMLTAERRRPPSKRVKSKLARGHTV